MATVVFAVVKDRDVYRDARLTSTDYIRAVKQRKRVVAIKIKLVVEWLLLF